MKFTQEQVLQIIKEEIDAVMNEDEEYRAFLRRMMSIEAAGRADGAAGGEMEGQDEINPDNLTPEERERYDLGFENAQIEGPSPT